MKKYFFRFTINIFLTTSFYFYFKQINLLHNKTINYGFYKYVNFKSASFKETLKLLKVEFYHDKYRVATLPGKTWNLRNFEKKTGKTWNFYQKSLKNLKRPGILTLSVVKFQFDSKNLSYK